jgi:hypothetical protein
VIRAFGCGRSWHERQNDAPPAVTPPDEDEAYGPFFGNEAYLPNWPFFTDCEPQFRKRRMRWYWRQAARLQALRDYARTPSAQTPTD